MFGLGNILYVSLLLINSLAILNEDRFLARNILVKLAGQQNRSTMSNSRSIDHFDSPSSGWLIPLIAINVLVIIYELILESSTSDGRTKLTLNSSFQVNFRRALTGGGNHCSFGVPCNTPINSIVSIDELDNMGLKNGRDSSSLKITSNGFGFLLEDVNTQLWDILLQYLKMTEANGVDVEYSFSNWTQTQTQVLQDLVDYGLVLVTAPDRFYPTRLATTLTSSAPPLVSAERAQEEDGFLVLETNYRVYAYTSNPLQIAVLNLFLSLRYRFPNLVVGAVTRESIKSALSNGITADQVIIYLHTHAHPQMRKFEPYSLLQSSIKSDCGNSKKTEFEPKKGSCMKTLNRRRNSTTYRSYGPPTRSSGEKTGLTTTITISQSYLLCPTLIVFHLAIAHLQQHSHNHPHSLVTVIIGSSTQASFQKALVDENDAFLMKASSDNSALSHLLERIEFRFCADLAQLLILLCDLSHQTLPVLSQSPRTALIFTDLTSYLISMPKPSLSDLTRLLGFISSVQLQLASFCPLNHPPPITFWIASNLPKMAVLCYAFFLDLERSIRGSSSSSEKPT
ncbi:hypothetical protein H4Q26_005974 [Puccinia striiformis f. sp. tritici PST-130]|nr:hypothetical protein H4Q26_005974 [Puccinia striiformis f. sp. tritici PST-130]